MIVKTLFASLFLAILFSSCDPNSDKQVGNASRFPTTTSNTGGSGGVGGVGSGGGTSSGGTSTDAPIDGGLSILLLAGSAYGVRRVRGMKQAEKNK